MHTKTAWHLILLVLSIATLTLLVMTFMEVQKGNSVIYGEMMSESEVMEEEVTLEAEEEMLEEPVNDTDEQTEELDSFLSVGFLNGAYGDTPYGAAEIRGYYTTIMKGTSFDNSTPDKECQGFVVTEAPDMLLDFLNETPAVEQENGMPAIVMGEIDSGGSWDPENTSSENTVKVLVLTATTFEGGLTGCMQWPLTGFLPAAE